jgi:hypothetical protein
MMEGINQFGSMEVRMIPPTNGTMILKNGILLKFMEKKY